MKKVMSRAASFESRLTVATIHRGNHTTYDPKSVPPQWRQWLSKTRHEAPSEEELLRYIAGQYCPNHVYVCKGRLTCRPIWRPAVY